MLSNVTVLVQHGNSGRYNKCNNWPEKEWLTSIMTWTDLSIKEGAWRTERGLTGDDYSIKITTDLVKINRPHQMTDHDQFIRRGLRDEPGWLEKWWTGVDFIKQKNWPKLTDSNQMTDLSIRDGFWWVWRTERGRTWAGYSIKKTTDLIKIN